MGARSAGVCIAPGAWRVTDHPGRDTTEPVRSTLVEILACGTTDHGDDGAATFAVARLAEATPEDVRTRTVGTLDIDHLLAISPGAGAIVVDTVVGVDPGWIVVIPFSGLAGRDIGIRPRSSHALAIPETVAVASIVRGRPLQGLFVGVGGLDFGPGEPLSWPVAAAIDTLVLAIRDAVCRVRRLVTEERRFGPTEPNGTRAA